MESLISLSPLTIVRVFCSQLESQQKTKPCHKTNLHCLSFLVMWCTALLKIFRHRFPYVNTMVSDGTICICKGHKHIKAVLSSLKTLRNISCLVLNWWHYFVYIRQFVLSFMGKQSKPVGCFYSIDKKETVDNLYQQSSLSIQNV